MMLLGETLEMEFESRPGIQPCEAARAEHCPAFRIPSTGKLLHLYDRIDICFDGSCV